ncbi:succinyl-diaminopimelate desuccinylase [Bartonella sp. HY329]|uniref:succinyl-diaminopimelate desuccinylase n=1 Tax=unclassified Bartonella TaxID=2645622 RepID=UPI0021C7CFB3|nr:MULTISPECIES: succinyl-diaminopimelate desuccinylase [unclassified Bartonella]UXM94784.1 succinyl-diaminopimelate desuccinylase [Bartonella sp. HY329]UXN09107.1 succinyl-diaminopimelate desuccinylase [Bartonella sp. HY328]
MNLENPVDILQKLIQCPSVTPDEGGALTLLQHIGEDLGFKVERPIFTADNTPDIENLYARFGSGGRHLMFAGHTDVVPTGDEAAWSHPPFAANITDNILYGRGAVDMKGGIACFIAAFARFINKQPKDKPFKESVSLLITGDEEGSAINGTVKLLEWAKNKGETWDSALVGEPTNPNFLGEMIKNGRRGSLSAIVTISGQQGHVAYPHLANNPLPFLLQLAQSLIATPLDKGTEQFQPSNLELTTIDTDNNATNIIAGKASFRFNIRFNDCWTVDSLKAEILSRLEKAANKFANNDEQKICNYNITWLANPADVFITHDEILINSLNSAIKKVTGNEAKLSTSGGTSDARFIKNYCPVVEFGLVGQTMHKIDECVNLIDVEHLTQIYEKFLDAFFA